MPYQPQEEEELKMANSNGNNLVPLIFTVMEFKPIADAKRICYLHHVAAFDSINAERLLLDAALLPWDHGDLFIQTDEGQRCSGAGSVKTYVTGGGKTSDNMSVWDESQFSKWAAQATSPWGPDGKQKPKTYRKVESGTR